MLTPHDAYLIAIEHIGKDNAATLSNHVLQNYDYVVICANSMMEGAASIAVNKHTGEAFTLRTIEAENEFLNQGEYTESRLDFPYPFSPNPWLDWN